jgi:hypothetical protein
MTAKQIRLCKIERLKAGHIHINPIPSVLIEELVTKKIGEPSTTTASHTAFCVYGRPFEYAICGKNFSGIP